MNYYITGDTHGDFEHIFEFCHFINTKKENDVMIVLGDAGINYQMATISGKPYHYEDTTQNIYYKKSFDKIPITFFIIQGNHEAPAWCCKGYKEKIWNGGIVYFQEDYPHLLFAKNGEIYHIDGKKVLVMGGAYSIDKIYRIHNNLRWFPEEQPNQQDKDFCERNLETHHWKVDAVLSHTCPFKYIPRETFIPNIDQNSVDNTTEKWLDKIEDNLEYNKWFCGHYHTDKVIDKIQFLFNNIKLFK